MKHGEKDMSAFQALAADASHHTNRQLTATVKFEIDTRQGAVRC
jgi:hypothetical protein